LPCNSSSSSGVPAKFNGISNGSNSSIHPQIG
jgi:hypothetical protein